MLVRRMSAGCRDERWRMLRLAWQPAFQSVSLEGYAELMDSSALQLAQHLKKAADSG
jgi:cytochrome P450